MLTDSRAARVFTGLLLVLLGVLLALPIPLTNYLFAGLILLYALALMERDGVLLLALWLASAAALAGMALVSGQLTALVASWLRYLG